MKNLITTLLFIVICTNAISQDQAVIKQSSYPDVESDLVIQIKDQGEEIQKLKDENKRLEEAINNHFQSQDKKINDSTSHFNSWLTYTAILISFLGVLATIFCAFSAWKIHLTEIDIRKQLKSHSRFIRSNLIILKNKCNELNSYCSDAKTQILEADNQIKEAQSQIDNAESKCSDLNKKMVKIDRKMKYLKDIGVEKIIDLKKEEDIQISKIFAQYADKKKRNMEDDHEFKDEINRYIDNLEKTDIQGKKRYTNEDLIYLGLKHYIDKKYQEVGLYWEQVNDQYDKYAYVLLLWGNALINCSISEKKSELFKEGCEKYKSAIKLDNKDERIFSNWANALAEWALIDKDPVFFNESFEKYDLAVKISPASSYIYYNWGVSLYDYAKSEFVEKEMIPKLYIQSCEKYKVATKIDPLDYYAFINWGLALLGLAQINNSEKLFEESCEKHRKAAELNSNDPSVYYNWGSILSELAQINNNEKLFEESCEKYKRAAELNSNDSNIYNNWGLALSDLAKIINNEKLFEESCEKFNKAAELNSNDSSIFYNWGATLLALAQLNNDLNSYKDEIESILKKAEAIKEGAGSYNLACLYSLLNQRDIALTWLENDLKHDPAPNKEEILSDLDFNNIKSDPQFKELLDKYFPEK